MGVFMKDKSVTNLVWELFEKSGQINYYLLAKKRSEKDNEK